MFSINKDNQKILTKLSIIALLAILVNPIAALDFAILGVYLLFAGHILLREKLILVFLLLRPTLNAWHDITIFTYQRGSINLNAALALAFFVWGALMFFKYSRFFDRLPLRFSLSAFIGLLLLSTLYSFSPATTVIETVKFVNLVLFFWLSFIFIERNKIKLRELVWAIILSAIAPVIIAAFQLIMGIGFDTGDVAGRIYGTLIHPNVLAFFLLSLIMLITVTQKQKNKKTKKHGSAETHRLKLFTVYCLLFTLLLFTYTRAAYIGLFLFVVIVGISKYRPLLLKFLLAVMLFFAVFFPLNEYLVAKHNINLQEIPLFGRLTSRNEDADSIAWRASILRENIPLIQTRPWLGYGYGVFPIVWEENRSQAHFWEDGLEAHNDYLRLAVEVGVVGLAIYILVLLGLIRESWRRNNLVLFAWVLVFAVLSLSDNMLNHTAVMWLSWSYWGAALAKPGPIESLLD